MRAWRRLAGRGAGGVAPPCDWPPHANAPRRLRARNHGDCDRGPTIVFNAKTGEVGRARLSGTRARKNGGMRITRNCKKGRTTTTRRFLLAIYVPASPLIESRPSRLLPPPPFSRERASARAAPSPVILTSFSLSSLSRIFLARKNASTGY